MSERNTEGSAMEVEWQKASLASVCGPPQYGAIAKGGNEYGGPLFIRQTDIVSGRVDWASVPRCDLPPAEVPKYAVREGDILVSRLGAGVGNAATVVDTRGAVFAGYLVRFQPDPQRVDPHFIGYHLQSQRWREHVHGFRGGAAQPTLNAQQMGAFEVLLPPLRDQRRIAHTLRAFDDKIELNRKMNETIEAMARALFKSWFVDFDPVRAKAAGRAPSGMDAETAKLFPSEFVDSGVGPIPKGWAAIPVYDIASYVNGAAYKAFEPNEERRGLPIIKIAELKAGVTANTKFSDVAMPEKYRLRTGDILFSWSGNPDTSIDTFIWAHGDAWLNQHIFRVDVSAAEERAFVLGTLKYLRPVFAEIARNKQTTGLGHVTAGDMQRLLVVKPDDGVLGAWNRLVGPIFAASFRAELESITLARLRDGLLPRLLSGELSVSAAERRASEVV